MQKVGDKKVNKHGLIHVKKILRRKSMRKVFIFIIVILLSIYIIFFLSCSVQSSNSSGSGSNISSNYIPGPEPYSMTVDPYWEICLCYK